jgi:DNA-binding IscR family transcriptional regulator
MSNTDSRTTIPGSFYWILNDLNTHWKDFRYLSRDRQVRRLGGMEFAVYHHLCRWADNATRECRMFQCEISEQMNCSQNSLRAYLRNLEGAKLIRMDRGRVIGRTLHCSPTAFTLLDIDEALQYGRLLSETDPEQLRDPCVNSASQDAKFECQDANSAPQDANFECQGANSSTNIILSKDGNKNSGGDSSRAPQIFSASQQIESSVISQPGTVKAQAGEEGEPPAGFPRAAGMARWCRERLGRAMFPVGLPAEELLATRLTLRPEVRAQLRAAPWPYLVISRQLAFALEDIRPRAPVGRQDPPVPVPDPRRKVNEKPSPSFTDEEWEEYMRIEREVCRQRTERLMMGLKAAVT